MIAAQQAGCIKILVQTGAGTEALRKSHNKEYVGLWSEVLLDFAAADLKEAVDWLYSGNIFNNHLISQEPQTVEISINNKD